MKALILGLALFSMLTASAQVPAGVDSAYRDLKAQLLRRNDLFTVAAVELGKQFPADKDSYREIAREFGKFSLLLDSIALPSVDGLARIRAAERQVLRFGAAHLMLVIGDHNGLEKHPFFQHFLPQLQGLEHRIKACRNRYNEACLESGQNELVYLIE